MSYFRKSIKFGLLLGGLGCFLCAQVAQGQTAVAPSASSSSSGSVNASSLAANEATFLQEQTTLSEEEESLISQGATPQQMEAWVQQNAARFAAQAARAKIMGAASYMHTEPLVAEAGVPDNASPTMSSFLVNRAALDNGLMETHNQMVQALGANGFNLALTPAGVAQIQSTQQSEDQVFRQQDATQIQVLVLQLPIVVQEWKAQLTGPEDTVAPYQPILLATPQWNAFMILHNQLIESEVVLINQNLTASNTQWNAGSRQWILLNTALVNQFLLSAENFSLSSQN